MYRRPDQRQVSAGVGGSGSYVYANTSPPRRGGTRWSEGDLFTLPSPPQWVGGLINHDRLKSFLGYKVFYSGVEGEHLTQSGGTKLPPDDVVLLPGWNWIGYAPLVSRDVNSGIEALSGNFTYDDQFKTRRGASVSFCTYSGSTLGFVGNLVELKPGVGYEVKVSRAITFAYTTSTTVET